MMSFLGSVVGLLVVVAILKVVDRELEQPYQRGKTWQPREPKDDAED